MKIKQLFHARNIILHFKKETDSNATVAEFEINLGIEAPNCKVYRNLLRLISREMRDTKLKDK